MGPLEQLPSSGQFSGKDLAIVVDVAAASSSIGSTEVAFSTTVNSATSADLAAVANLGSISAITWSSEVAEFVACSAGFLK